VSAPEKDTCLVIVTYGNRCELIEEVICRLKTMGIGELIVVDNGLADATRAFLETEQRSLGCKMSVVRNQKNLGSAPGFSAGLRYFVDNSRLPYVWLLDDDNRPYPDALERLHAAIGNAENELVAGCAYRCVGRGRFRRLASGQSPRWLFAWPSAFFWFPYSASDVQEDRKTKI